MKKEEQTVTLKVELQEGMMETLKQVAENFRKADELLSENKKLLKKLLVDDLIEKCLNQKFFKFVYVFTAFHKNIIFDS